MYKVFFIVLLVVAQRVSAQTDSGSVVVVKDPRVDLLMKKQIEINEETTKDTRRNMPGFRIQVINSPDRNKVFAAKAKVYQEFPDMKPYLLYQAPNYKLKVGNFKTQEEAEEAQKQLERFFSTGLYVVRDIIEVRVGDLPKDSTTP
ncbi:MAG: SPOR domain-containing protein [Bacteroidetes bacterium]|nr:SPOR domain-containing protein [Bacteroidota bacterium]